LQSGCRQGWLHNKWLPAQEFEREVTASRKHQITQEEMSGIRVVRGHHQHLPRKDGCRNAAFTHIDRIAEASSRHYLQKKSSNPSVNVEGASFLPSTNVRTNNADFQSGPTNRKRQVSIQNQKGPMGPRPLDASSGKRLERRHLPSRSSADKTRRQIIQQHSQCISFHHCEYLGKSSRAAGVNQ
jgi:hypothetical protein